MTSAEIVQLACQIAKGPLMIQIGGKFLNMVLEELALIRNLKINRVTRLLTVGPNSYGPYALEGDYLRTYDLFYPLPSQGVQGGTTTGGITVFLHPITMEQWDSEFKSPSTANYPYEFATDLSTQAQVWSGGSPGSGTLTSAGQLFIYPQSSGVIVLTHRYMKNQPTFSNPQCITDSVWFPYADYLVTRVAGMMMGVTGDDRREAYLERAETMLRPYLIQEGDEQQTVQSVRLDPRHFHPAQSAKPTKAYPY